MFYNFVMQVKYIENCSYLQIVDFREIFIQEIVNYLKVYIGFIQYGMGGGGGGEKEYWGMYLYMIIVVYILFILQDYKIFRFNVLFVIYMYLYM